MYGKLCVLVLIVGVQLSFAGGIPAVESVKIAKHRTTNRFLENKGQWPVEVLFGAHIPGGSAFFTRNGIVYSFYDSEAAKNYKSCNSCHETEMPLHDHTHMAMPRQPKHLGQPIKAHAYRVTFVGSNSQIKAYGAGVGNESFNFFLGTDPSQWASQVKAFQELWYADIYPGIDLRIYSQQNNLKYDFIIKPGADPKSIALKYEGIDGILLKNHQLHVSTSVNEVVEEKPFAFQVIKKDTVEIASNYRLIGNTVTFQLDKYDNQQRLVIDPLLVFSSYSGSLAANWGNTATYDNEGNLYSGGIARSMGFPTTLGAFQLDFAGEWDVAIMKYDSTGSQLLYGTYLGGSLAETPQSMVVNQLGELLIFGTTSSIDFPIIDGYQKTFAGGNSTEALSGIFYHNGSDMFIAKLSNDGSQLLASTYLGGSDNDGINYNFNPLVKNYGDQYRGDIFVGIDNHVYVASNTSSVDFPMINGWQTTYGGGTHDGVVFKLTPDLSQLVWSSFLGGNEPDAAYSIKVNAANEVYVAGGTVSSNFFTTPGTFMPEKPGGLDGFVVRINQQSMQIDRSSYIGTPEYDQVYFLDLDNSGFVYLLGQTQGNYPVVSRAGRTLYTNPKSGQFIQKLTRDLQFTPECFSTVFGSGSGSPDISLTAFMINDCGDIYISGWGGAINGTFFNGVLSDYVGGSTHNLPITNDAFQKTTDGSDFYLMVLHPDAMALMYATYFGGVTQPGEHVDGGTSRFDKRGIVYQAVCAGCWTNANESDFPVTENAWSRQNLSPNCNNAAFKFNLADLNADFTTNVDEGCFPLEVVFNNTSIGGRTFFWDFGNGQTSAQKSNLAIRYDEPGIYYVVLIAIDPSTCAKVDFAAKYIHVYDHDFEVGPSDTICEGEEIQLHASGGQDYVWSPAGSLSDPNSPNPIASPSATTHYEVRATNEYNCDLVGKVTVEVIPEIEVDFQMIRDLECSGMTPIRFINNGTEGANYLWDFGNGVTSTEKNPEYLYPISGEYQIHLKGWIGSCQNEITKTVQINDFLVPNVITPNNDGFNDVLVLGQEGLQIEVYNRWGKRVFESNAYNNDWSGGDLPTGVYYYRIILNDKETCKGWLHILK